MAHHYAHRHDAATFEHVTLAGQSRPRQSSRRRPFDPQEVAKRVLAILQTEEKARMIMAYGKPRASRMDATFRGRVIAIYDRNATLEMIARDAADAFGWVT